MLQHRLIAWRLGGRRQALAPALWKPPQGQTMVCRNIMSCSYVSRTVQQIQMSPGFTFAWASATFACVNLCWSRSVVFRAAVSRLFGEQVIRGQQHRLHSGRRAHMTHTWATSFSFLRRPTIAPCAALFESAASTRCCACFDFAMASVYSASAFLSLVSASRKRSRPAAVEVYGGRRTSSCEITCCTPCVGCECPNITQLGRRP